MTNAVDVYKNNYTTLYFVLFFLLINKTNYTSNHNYSISGPVYFLAKRERNLIKNTRKQYYTPNFPLKTININKTNVKLWYFYISACVTQ